jgi:hypothetical protein
MSGLGRLWICGIVTQLALKAMHLDMNIGHMNCNPTLCTWGIITLLTFPRLYPQVNCTSVLVQTGLGCSLEVTEDTLHFLWVSSGLSVFVWCVDSQFSAAYWAPLILQSFFMEGKSIFRCHYSKFSVHFQQQKQLSMPNWLNRTRWAELTTHCKKEAAVSICNMQLVVMWRINVALYVLY